MSKIKLAIAEDHAMIGESLAMMLNNDKSFEVTQLALNGQDLIELINLADNKPDIVLMDIEMPVLDGFKTSERIVNLFPTTKIIYLTSHFSKFHIEKAIRTHANAYLLKDSDSDTLIKAIKNVAQKGIHQNEYFNFNIIQEVIGKKRSTNEIGQLTVKEKEFVRLLCLDKDLKDIATEMGNTIETARIYRKRIMSKLGVRKTTGIILFALKNHQF